MDLNQGWGGQYDPDSYYQSQLLLDSDVFNLVLINQFYIFKTKTAPKKQFFKGAL